MLKEDERPVRCLSGTQIQELLTASLPYPALRMRILLALGTGLRRGDIESWRVSDLDFDICSVTTRSTKTRKSMGSRPVLVPIMAELKRYIADLPPKQDKIFERCFNKSRWDKVRRKVGLADCEFHDLRNYADTPIMPSRILYSSLLSSKIAHSIRLNNLYSA